MGEKICYICNDNIEGFYQDLFVDCTKHSKVLFCEVVQKILKRDLEKNEENLICYCCINRINKFDFAIVLAEKMEKEILDSFQKTEIKYDIIQLAELKEEDLEKDDSLDYVELETEWSKCDNQEHFEIYAMDESQNELTSNKDNNDDSDHFVIETLAIDIKPFKISDKTKSKRRYCEICEITFSSVAEYKEHKETIHCEIASNLQCHICGVGFEARSRLTNHMKTHQEPIKCTLCGKKFGQKGALKRHMAIHTGEKPYQCDICGKQFIHASSFHMHNLAHGNIREETCQICGYKLRSRSHLNRHMLIHTGEKKHECPICGQKFAQRYNMNVHLKLHEGIKRQKSKVIHICTVCDIKFKTLKALNEHNEKFHEIESYTDDRHFAQLENLIEDQSEIYDNSIMDAYSDDQVKVELLL